MRDGGSFVPGRQIVLLVAFLLTLHPEVLHGETPRILVDAEQIRSGRIVDLNGTWEFFPGVLGRSASSLRSRSVEPRSITVPRGVRLRRDPSGGTGTYRVIVEFSEPIEEPLAVHIGFVPTAVELWIDDQEIVAVGSPALSPEDHRPQWHPATGSFIPTDPTEVELRIVVANHFHTVGGLRSVVQIGTAETVATARSRSAFLDAGFLGAVFLIGFYHLFLFLKRRSMAILLWFGVMAVAFGVRSGFNNAIYWNALFPSIPWTLMLRIEYLAVYVATLAFIMFAAESIDRRPPHLLYRGFLGVVLLCIVVTVVTPPRFFTAVIPIGQGALLVMVVWLLVETIRNIHRQAAVLLAIGLAIVFVGVIGDTFYFGGIVGLPALMSIAGFVFILFETSVLAHIFIEAYDRKQVLSGQLAETIERLETAHQQDHITGLPNRQAFNRVLEREIARGKRNKTRVAVLFIDLDNFKQVNDTMGHHQGDVVLQNVARRIQRIIRETDTLFRIGGDEFVIVCVDLQKADDVHRIASAINGALAHTFGLQGREVYLGGSIGIALYPDHGNDAGDLLSRSDAAMYEAKRAGRGRYRLYESVGSVLPADHVTIVGRLARAIQAGTLEVHYQPQFLIPDLEMSSVEALVRWNDPEIGSISPAKFIPMAEENGLVVSLGSWVLRRSLNIFPAHFVDREVTIGINLSPAQLNDVRFIEEVDQILAETGFDPTKIMFEVTEHAVMRNWEASKLTINALRDRGIGIALDDFGTGYSSLQNLHGLAADQLKVDRSFVARIDVDERDRDIVAWIVSLGHSMGMEVCLEGIETRTQLEVALELGADLLQGFLLARPVRPAEIPSFTPDPRLELPLRARNG